MPIVLRLASQRPGLPRLLGSPRISPRAATIALACSSKRCRSRRYSGGAASVICAWAKSLIVSQAVEKHS